MNFDIESICCREIFPQLKISVNETHGNSCWYIHTRYSIFFILFQFHNYFDGLIGLNDIRNKNFSKDFSRNTLFSDYVKISAHFNYNRQEYAISRQRQNYLNYFQPANTSYELFRLPQMTILKF